MPDRRTSWPRSERAAVIRLRASRNMLGGGYYRGAGILLTAPGTSKTPSPVPSRLQRVAELSRSM